MTTSYSDETKQMMADAFDRFFRFKIGDIVVPKSTIASFRADAEVNGRFDKYSLGSGRVNTHVGEVVVERTLQQCHGGVQGFYQIRRTDPKGMTIFERIAEIEVDSYGAFVEAAKMLAAERKDKEGP